MKNLYKILVDGRSCHGGSLEWSLPDGDKPGDWHEIAGDLIQCSNGLHLTTDPSARWQSDAEAYLVEVDLDGVIGNPARDEEVVVRKARLLRRLTWAELAVFGITPDGVDRDAKYQTAKAKRLYGPPPPPPKKRPSPAMCLVQTVWENRCGSTEHSWRRVNDSMSKALMLAIRGGMSFAKGDFADISSNMRGGFWMGDAERFYRAAIEEGHTQACQSFEAWTGRPAFIWEGKRLHVGSKLPWAGEVCTVTSMSGDRLIACSYKPSNARHGSTPIDRRFSIMAADLRRAERDRKIELTVLASAKEVQNALSDCGLSVAVEAIVAWSPEQRAEASEWASTAKVDARKKRVRPPPAPAHVLVGAAPALADERAKKLARERRWRMEEIERHAKEIGDIDRVIAELSADVTAEKAA